MKVRFTFMLAVAACVSGFTEKDVEEGRDAFLSCLRSELASKLALRMDSEDFALSVKGTCTREADRFVDTFVDYMWSRFPTIDAADHIARHARLSMGGGLRARGPTRTPCASREIEWRGYPVSWKRCVNFGSQADICTAKSHVCFSPESGHLLPIMECALYW